MKNYKWPGIDWIPAQSVQSGGKAVCSDIHELVIPIWNKTKLCQQWKESVIVPIYKVGDRTGCSNYWNMSLLLTAYKLSTFFSQG